MPGPERFGTLPDGRIVHRVTLRGGGLECGVLTLGAMLQDVRFAGHDMVLPVPSVEAALAKGGYVGATVGRYANRIAEGRCLINGRAVQLDRNDGPHHLHGGRDGTSAQLWTLADHGPDHAELHLTLPDGHMGYPGRLEIAAQVALRDAGVLAIRYRARTDAPTLCNLSHHSYFTLGAPSLRTLLLRVAADQVLVTDAGGIPQGAPVSVDATRFDFRTLRRFAADGRLDNNFCLSPGRTALRPVAWLVNPPLGVSMELHSTEPGLQVYDAHKETEQSNEGSVLSRHCGVALEPQIWPDSPNRPEFAQALLLPGEVYDHRLEARFALGSAG